MSEHAWKERFRAFAFILSANAFFSPAIWAEDRPLLHRPEKELRSIKPVNVDMEYGVVSGTVTVRLFGVPVSPQQVTYAFQPEFPNSRGRLRKKAEGVFVLKLHQVPSDSSHILTITGIYNDTLIQGGVVQRQGQTRTGRIQLSIPHGRSDHSFGEQFLDLR